MRLPHHGSGREEHHRALSQIKDVIDAVRADMRRARRFAVLVDIDSHRPRAGAQDDLPRRITRKAAGSGAMAGQQQCRREQQGSIPSKQCHWHNHISGRQTCHKPRPKAAGKESRR